MTFWELLEDTYQLTGYWWLTGLLWIPVLAVFSFRALNDGIDGFEGLLIKSTGLVLVFFLTRSWLSEPNIILVLPSYINFDLDRKTKPYRSCCSLDTTVYIYYIQPIPTAASIPHIS